VSRLRRISRLVLLCLLMSAAPAAAASSYSAVLHEYETRGTIPACAFTAAQLSAALKGVDVYGQQYFADFTAAIQTALSQRASGQCTAGTPTATPAGTTHPDPTLRITLPGVTAATGAGLPLPVVALLVLGLVAGLLIVAARLRRRRAPDEGPSGSWRQLWGETAWRTAGWWAEARDRRRGGS
jgi:hypothetical protein